MGQNRSYKTYPKEFKEEVVNLVNEQGQPMVVNNKLHRK